jgi:LmbE family N-acetylglucosaminyl deacetylase
MSKSNSRQVLISVLAHPDDESFGMGGTLAKYARNGVEVHLICATRGEAGEVPPKYRQREEPIAVLRESELHCASDQLGISQVHFLEYRDSGMSGSPDNQHPRALANAPTAEVAAKILRIMEEVEAQVVLTFDPIGGYYHPDHIAIHKAAKEAFFKAREQQTSNPTSSWQPEKLYYHTISKRYIRYNVRLLRLLGKDPSRWGKNKDIDLTRLAVDDFPVHARIDYRGVRKQKQAAASCHASQGGAGLFRGIRTWIFRLFGLGFEDEYMRAYPPPEEGLVERDLFSDLS